MFASIFTLSINFNLNIFSMSETSFIFLSIMISISGTISTPLMAWFSISVGKFEHKLTSIQSFQSIPTITSINSNNCSKFRSIYMSMCEPLSNLLICKDR